MYGCATHQKIHYSIHQLFLLFGLLNNKYLVSFIDGIITKNEVLNEANFMFFDWGIFYNKVDGDTNYSIQGIGHRWAKYSTKIDCAIHVISECFDSSNILAIAGSDTLMKAIGAHLSSLDINSSYSLFQTGIINYKSLSVDC